MMEAYHPAADRLEAFVEGVLDSAERAVLESHLLGCPHCQTQVEEWRALFAALEGLPQFEPAAGFAERVMASVVFAPKASWSWQQQAARAGEMLNRILPETSFGWALATALLSLPVILGGGTVAWWFQKTTMTPDGLWSLATTWAVEGLQGIGTTAITAVVRTDLAVWLAAQGTELISRAGVSGLGLIVLALGCTTLLSGWILYRNLFRTPTRESNYVSYSF